MPDGPQAALLVHVWLEDGPDTFRARVTSLPGPGDDESSDELTLTVTASPPEVVDAVTSWLAEFLRRSQTD